jgi:hypothetical protein
MAQEGNEQVGDRPAGRAGTAESPPPAGTCKRLSFSEGQVPANNLVFAF